MGFKFGQLEGISLENSREVASNVDDIGGFTIPRTCTHFVGKRMEFFKVLV